MYATSSYCHSTAVRKYTPGSVRLSQGRHHCCPTVCAAKRKQPRPQNTNRSKHGSVHLEVQGGDATPLTAASQSGVGFTQSRVDNTDREHARLTTGVSRAGEPAPAQAAGIATQAGNQDHSERDQGQPTASSSTNEDAALPVVARGRIFASCFQVSATLFVLGLFLRLYAVSLGIAALGNDPEAVERLLSVPQGLDLQHVGVAVAAAAMVAAGRQLLLMSWPDFAEASGRSNQQVLAPLQWFDLVWVSCLPAVSEEVFFRGGLIPASFPDWRGVLIAGVAFGSLHVTGGRNWAFAGWASLVGILYGCAFVYTQDIMVPVVAHSLANLASAVLWKAGNPEPQ